MKRDRAVAWWGLWWRCWDGGLEVVKAGEQPVCCKDMVLKPANIGNRGAELGASVQKPPLRLES